MLTGTDLIRAYERNFLIIKNQTADMSHAESLIQLPFRANCLNWTLGHMCVSRVNLLATLGAEPPFAPELLARYERESEPITADSDGVVPLEQLLELLEQTQSAIKATFSAKSDDDWAGDVIFANRPTQAAKYAFFMYFHDSYHTGQTEILRQASGKNDKII